MDIRQIVNDALFELEQSGKMEELITEAITKCFKEQLESAINGWGNPISKTINEKLKEVCQTAIEGYDFSAYLTKVTSIIDKVVKNSVLPEHKRLLENLEIALTPAPKQIKLSELFEQYCKHIKALDITAKDEDSAELELKLYLDDTTGQWVFTYNEEDTTYESELQDHVFKMSLGEGYSSGLFISHVVNKGIMNAVTSFRFMKPFALMLMELSQNFTEIEIDGDYWEKTIELDVEY